jgi:uncharacterized protein YjbI with pentapeptide repeats
MNRANNEYLDCLKSGVSHWNAWRANNPDVIPSFNGLDLSSLDLSGANLEGADFRQAILRHTALGSANLRNADFTDAQCLCPDQFAGSDLGGAKLPKELTFDILENINDRLAFFHNAVLAVLLGCVYAGLTVATTTDVRLITNSASSPLPILSTAVPIRAFYIVTPLILVATYIYIHLARQQLSLDLTRLPSIFPDGLHLVKKISSSLFQLSCLAYHSIDEPLTKFQIVGSVVLVWWAIPVTLLVMLYRCLFIHDTIITIYYLILLWLAIFTALFFRFVRSQLPANGSAAVPISQYLHILRHQRLRHSSLALAAIFVTACLAPFIPGRLFSADLKDGELSTKPATWTGLEERSREEIAAVKGAHLAWHDLSYADGQGAFLVKADMTDCNCKLAVFKNADLRYADLRGADLYAADLRGANLRAANLAQASLHDVNFKHADLRGASLKRANVLGVIFEDCQLEGADLSGVRNANVVAIRSARDWTKAHYDSSLLSQLGLQAQTSSQ